MDHDGSFFFSGGRNVLQTEVFGQGKVALDGPALPGAPQSVLDPEIDLRPVEGAAAGAFFVLKTFTRERAAERRRGLFPDFVRADRVFGPRRELYLVLVEAKGLKDVEHKVDDLYDLRFELFRQAENMRVVLGEVPNAQQAVQDA